MSGGASGDWMDPDDSPEIELAEVVALEAKYVGRVFVFVSPFEGTPGWEEGDEGILVRLQTWHRGDPVDPEVPDLWEGLNLRTHELASLWGGEAMAIEGGCGVIAEQSFCDRNLYRLQGE